MATTNLRNVRLDDPLWDAAKWLARHQGTTASAKVRDMLDEWISEAADDDPAVAAAPMVRRHLSPRPLAAVVAAEEGPQPDGPQDVDEVRRERFGAPRAPLFMPPATNRRSA